MRKSAPITALLLIWFLACSQIVIFGAHVNQEANAANPGSSQKAGSVAKKSKKKRRKRKTVSSAFPYFALPGSADSVTKSVATAQGPSASSIPVPQTRTINRASRTPGIHITPVAVKQVGAPLFSGSNNTPITIGAENFGPEPIPAEPYSSDIDVLALQGVVTSVSVTINGLQHSSPDDLDMLLVAPNDRSFHFWSDVGGTAPANGVLPQAITVTVSDDGATFLPDDGPLINGTTYKPFNNDTVGDEFPLPAIGPPYNEPASAGAATFASVFGGMTGEQAGGTWRLFVTDDQNGNGGVISEGWTLNISTQIPATAAGQFVISEFRTSGPLGSSDDFVELYNTTGASLIVQAADATGGLSIASSDGTVRCIVPNGTVVPTNGHYLCANTNVVNSSNRARRTADSTILGDIPDNAGIAIFATTGTGPSNQNLANRIDAVGPVVEPNTLYKEGNGYPTLNTTNLDYSFYRDLRPNGVPKDTGDNAADFLFVDTNGTSTSAGQRLGAPSPEGLTDVRTTNDEVAISVVAPCVGSADSPNRIRSLDPDPANNSTFGTLSIRRAITNLTGNDITRLRFKIIDLTTFPAPAGTADLRLRTSSTTTEVDQCNQNATIDLAGITLEQPPAQPNGGGFNSNGIVTLPAPLPPSETIFVNFLFGVQQTGRFLVYVNIETLP